MSDGGRFRRPDAATGDQDEHETGAIEMINHALAGIAIKAMLPLSPMPLMSGTPASKAVDLLPPLVTWLWLGALAAVLIFHCGHLVRMGGQHRWFHASHALMLVSMLYMFASMEFKWNWFPPSSWVVIFGLSTAAILGWMILRVVQRRPFSFLWILALVMQATMIYMWMPHWIPVLTWTLVVYFGLETVAWLIGRVDDSKPATAVGPGERALVVPAVPDSAPSPSKLATRPGSVAVVLLDPKPVTASLSLGEGSAVGQVSMAIMAASIGYMFAAMQLMRSAM
jgi:hypothetical protein